MESASATEEEYNEGSALLESMEVNVRDMTRRTTGGCSWLISAVIIMNATFGTGLVNLPQAFDVAGGIAAGILMQLVIITLAFAALVILVWCSDLRGSMTYQDVVSDLCGPNMRRLCSVFMAVYCFGACLSFLVVVGDQSDQIFYHLLGQDFCSTWYARRFFTIPVVSIVFVLPFCFASRIDVLKYISTLSNVGVLYLVIMVMVNFGQHDVTEPVEIKTSPTRWTDVFMAVASFCFAYQTHASIVPIYACTVPRTVPVFTKSLVLSISTIFVVYSFVGLLSYLTFGTKVKPDILSCYDVGHPWVAVGFILFALKMLLSYPVIEFCGRTALETLWMEIRGNTPLEAELYKKKRALILGFAWFFISVLICVMLPDIAFVIEGLGCISALFMFIFPGICLLKSAFHLESILTASQYWAAQLVASFFIVIGFFIFGLALAQSVMYQFQVHPLDIQICH